MVVTHIHFRVKQTVIAGCCIEIYSSVGYRIAERATAPWQARPLLHRR